MDLGTKGQPLQPGVGTGPPWRVGLAPSSRKWATPDQRRLGHGQAFRREPELRLLRQRYED